jgi:hypothetical protein
MNMTGAEPRQAKQKQQNRLKNTTITSTANSKPNLQFYFKQHRQQYAQTPKPNQNKLARKSTRKSTTSIKTQEVPQAHQQPIKEATNE